MPGSYSYGKSVLIASVQVVNALCGGRPDETLSGRAWRREQAGKGLWPRRGIDRAAAIFGDTNHCRECCGSGRLLRQMPPELRLF